MKRHKRQTQKPLPVDRFSPAEIRLAQNALTQLETWLRQAGNEATQNAFAEETLSQLKNKLETMHCLVNHLVPFDYNEMVLLRAALQGYVVDLLSSPPTPERAAHLKHCEHLSAFAQQSLLVSRPPATHEAGRDEPP